MTRRRILLAALAAPLVGQAQPAWPSRPVRVLVPYAPGGGSDILARVLAPSLLAVTGQAFAIENRAGGASIPGTQAALTAAPDGTTLGLSDLAMAINPALFGSRLPYELPRDVAAISVLTTTPIVLAAHGAAPAVTLADVVAAARSGAAIGHAGVGTANHLAFAQLQQAAGADLTGIGYRGGGPMTAALVSGEVPYAMAIAPTMLPHAAGGRVRILAQSGARRSALLPDVPTFAEAGMPGVDVEPFWIVFAPSGTPQPVLASASAAFQRAMAEPAVAERLRGLGYALVGSGSDEAQSYLAAAIARLADVIRRGDIRPE